MATRPVDLPRWATAGTATTPPGSKQDSGWLFKEKPPFDYFNWLQLRNYQWLKFFDDRLAPLIDDNGVLLADVVTTAAIQAAAVTTAKINDLAVTTAKLDALAVTAAKLAADAVYTAAIQDLAVTTAKLDDLSVTAAKLAANAVYTAAIQNDAVTVAKLAGGTADRAFITDGAGDPAIGQIVTSAIANDAVTTAKIAATGTAGYPLRMNDAGTAVGFSQVGNAGIEDNAVSAGKIAHHSGYGALLYDVTGTPGAALVTNNHIAANTITAANIAAGAVGESELATNAVVGPKVKMATYTHSGGPSVPAGDSATFSIVLPVGAIPVAIYANNVNLLAVFNAINSGYDPTVTVYNFDGSAHTANPSVRYIAET